MERFLRWLTARCRRELRTGIWYTPPAALAALAALDRQAGQDQP